MLSLFQTDWLVLVQEAALLEETGPQESLVGSLDRQGSIVGGCFLSHGAHCLAILSSPKVQNGGNSLQLLPVSLALLDDAIDLLHLPVRSALLQLLHLLRSRHVQFFFLHGGSSKWLLRSLDLDFWRMGAAIVAGTILLDFIHVAIRKCPPDLTCECIVVLVLTHGNLLHLNGGRST